MFGDGMTWHEISIQVPEEYVEPVSYLFNRYGHGLSMENTGNDLVLMRTYLPNTSKRRLARIEVGVNLVRLLEPMGELVVEPLEGADWENAWKAHFSLLKVGKRLVIKPSWIEYEGEPDETVIELDPGMAFGTGYHPTTRMCLEALEHLVRPGMEILDLGTGSGILSIAAARLNAGSVLSLDIDPTAVKAARKNFRAARLTSKVRLVRGTLPNPMVERGRFDLAMANISARVVRERGPDLLHALKPGGRLIASGVMQKQQWELEGGLLDSGFRLQDTYSLDEWVALVLFRP